MLEEEILERFEVHDLPADYRREFVGNMAEDQVSGGRIYDAHIAEVAVHAQTKIIVTENIRHFVSLEDRGVAVMAPASFLQYLGAG